MSNLLDSLMRKVCGALVGVALVASTASYATAQEKRLTLRVGDLGSQARDLLQGSGLDKDLSYDIVWNNFTSIADLAAAISSAQIDVAFHADIGLITLAASNLPFSVITANQRPTNTCGVLVPSDSPIKTVEDLRGRSVANSPGQTSDLILQRALAKAGLKPSDLNIVRLNSLSEGRAAYVAGRVEAWAACQPLLLSTKLEQNGRLIVTGENGLWNGQIFWFSPRSVLADEKASKAVLDFVRRENDARIWAGKNVRAYSEVQSKTNKLPVEVNEYINNYGATHPIPVTQTVIKELQETYEFLTTLGSIPKGANIADVFDKNYDAELGMK